MKTTLSISLLLICALSWSQRFAFSNSTHLGEPTSVDSANWEQAYKDYYYAITEANRPGVDTADKQNDAIYSLDTAGFIGVGGRMDMLLFMASKSEEAALTDVIFPDSSATNENATSFTLYEGYTGDELADYIQTNRNLLTETSNYTQDDGSIGVYIRNNSASEGSVFGTTEVSGPVMRLFPRYIDNTAQASINSGASDASGSNNDSRGLFIATRTGASTLNVYRNGSSVVSASTTSTGVPDREMIILANQQNYTVGDFSGYQVAIFFIMDGVSSTEASTLNTIFETYMDAIGAGVQ